MPLYLSVEWYVELGMVVGGRIFKRFLARNRRRPDDPVAVLKHVASTHSKEVINRIKRRKNTDEHHLNFSRLNR